MTKAELLSTLKAMDNAQQSRWMFSFGRESTVTARGSYGEEQPEIEQKALMGFNEIQHRVYGRIESLNCSAEWTEESYINDVMLMARHYGIEGQVTTALQKVTPLQQAS